MRVWIAVAEVASPPPDEAKPVLKNRFSSTVPKGVSMNFCVVAREMVD